MKRLPLTPELIADIKLAVGEDVDVDERYAVFESISLNSLPLPGKAGTIFEKATISLLTLTQMVSNINNGNHLPLIHGHNLDTIPVGRVFKAGLQLDAATGAAELRTLWYIDPTEAKLAEKIDAGSLDEVSVQFLASQILCSECEFDYRNPLEATWQNFRDRTCANGHTIGEDGVHARLVGLEQFTELSLVTRGAASKPKIVGRSQSKLAAPLQALAAKGFEVDELYLTASKGEIQVDVTAILAQLTEQTTLAATATAQNTALTATNADLTTQLAARDTRIAELEAAAAENTDATALTAAQAEVTEAKTFLAGVYTKLATAAGETDVTAPETIADLQAGIETYQSKLSAVLPVGGAAASTQTNDAQTGAKFNASTASAFAVNR